MDDAKRHNAMESSLQLLNNRYVSLGEEEVKRNNIILNTVLTFIVTRMREIDRLFDNLFTYMFFGGSYYDGLKVGSPNEYDIDLLLKFPSTAECEIRNSNKPGFVHVSLNNKSGYEKLCGRWGNYLDTKLVLSWMEGVITRAINDFQIPWWCDDVQLEITIQKGGPAFTMILTGEYDREYIDMSIDLVPCFIFNNTEWPANGFKQNPYSHLPDFFVVPKTPKSTPNYGTAYWRLSLQIQERYLINNKEKLKPALRLLKKMRDVLGHQSISSYYLKTVVMWEVDEKPSCFWSSHSLSYIFMHILKKYKEYLSQRKIPYFWYKKYDLLQVLEPDTISNICNRQTRIINDIERNLPHNPEVILKYLLTSAEYDELFQDEVADEPPAAPTTEGTWCRIL